MNSSIQTNVQQGKFPINSGIALTGKEGYLVKLADQGTQPEVLLPTDEADVCQYVVDYGGALDTDSEVIPLVQGQQVRLVAKGSGNSGDRLVLADISTAAGKVEKTPTDADTYFAVGYAEEDFADGQHVLCRVWTGEVTVTE